MSGTFPRPHISLKEIDASTESLCVQLVDGCCVSHLMLTWREDVVSVWVQRSTERCIDPIICCLYLLWCVALSNVCVFDFQDEWGVSCVLACVAHVQCFLLSIVPDLLLLYPLSIAFCWVCCCCRVWSVYCVWTRVPHFVFVQLCMRMCVCLWGRYTGIMDDHLQSTALSRMPPRFSSLVQQMSPEDELAADAQERVFDMSAPSHIDWLLNHRVSWLGMGTIARSSKATCQPAWSLKNQWTRQKTENHLPRQIWWLIFILFWFFFVLDLSLNSLVMMFLNHQIFWRLFCTIFVICTIAP